MVEFTLDIVTIMQFVVTSLMPLVVGLITTRVTHGGVKATLLAAATLITSLGAEFIRAAEQNEVYDLGQGLFLALPAFATAIGLYYGLYKPTGVAGAAQDVLVTPKAHDSTARAGKHV